MESLFSEDQLKNRFKSFVSSGVYNKLLASAIF